MKFFILFLTIFSSLYGVVSVAPVEIGKNPGVSGVLEASIENARGNTDKDEYKGGLKVQYDNNSSYVIWAEASVNYAEVEGIKNTNKSYGHLRYIHTFYEKQDVNYELFAQVQTNEFTKIKNRSLAGGGYRFYLVHESMGKLFAGIGGFYEYIQYTTNIDPHENNLRTNFYLSYTNQLGDDSTISYVGYYQPKFGDLNDYIITNILELQVHIYKKFFISLKVNYDYDSKPAVSVEKRDFTQTTSLIFKF
ncbi:DUF481 domain-containing protein [Sulfurimonas sp. C5]|uniref:DUF481 domain-containing protein n=1 Tax=Sulfurimonas sp. C5 TaxID=3036947 RepID=UPI002457AD21|nr:DUF481 domain-containing protein [Sulfurimonas sp. C5]MDH4943770.1 DUF481 domain-containing protein [Sulfurimonas sp. C5]